jgi:hypothetical protein
MHSSLEQFKGKLQSRSVTSDELTQYFASVSKEEATEISLQQKALLRAAVEFFVVRELISQFQPEVGLSPSARGWKQEGVITPSMPLTAATKVLFGFLQNETFQEILLSKHVVDLLVATMHLSQSNESATDPGALLDDFGTNGKDYLLRTLHPVLIFESLLPLLRTAPAWLSQQVVDALTLTLVRSGGVEALLQHALGAEDPAVGRRFVGLIASQPKSLPPGDYFGSVGSQLVRIFHLKAQRTESQEELEKLQALALQVAGQLVYRGAVFRDHFFAKIVRPLDTLSSSKELALDEVLAEESEIALLVRDLGRLTDQLIHRNLYLCLSPYIASLFRLAAFAFQMRSFLVTQVEEILVKFFSAEGSERLLSLIFSPEAVEADGSVPAFAPGGTGGVVIRTATRSESSPKARADSLANLLNRFADPRLKGDVFVELFSRITTQASATAAPDETWILLFEQLAARPDALLRDNVQVFAVLKSALASQSPESSVLVLQILEHFLAARPTLPSEIVVMVYDLLPLLRELPLTDSALRDRVCALIHSRSWAESPPEQTELAHEYSLREILQEIRDPLLPVRAHGLLRLRRLVLRRDEQALRNLDKIFALFETQSHDPEAFVFLAAVQGLAALADLYPAQVVPRLTGLGARESEEQRLRLAETLVLVAERCGELLSHHIDLFLPYFLQQLASESPTLRASALSGLGTLCELLRYSLGRFLPAVLDSLEPRLRETDVLVRRAAVFVLVQIVRGLPDSAAAALLRVRPLLVAAAASSDPVAQAQAEGGLEQIDRRLAGPQPQSIFRIVE